MAEFHNAVQSVLDRKASDDILISRSPLLQLVDEHGGLWSHVPSTGDKFSRLPAIPIVSVMRSITDNNGQYTGVNDFLQKTSQWVTSCMTVNYCARDLPRIAFISRTTENVFKGTYIIMDRGETMGFDEAALSKDVDTESTLLLGAAGFMSHIDKVAICPPVKTELHADKYYMRVVKHIMDTAPWVFDCTDWDHYASEGRILRFTKRVRCAMQLSNSDLMSIFNSVPDDGPNESYGKTVLKFRRHKRVVFARKDDILKLAKDWPRWIGFAFKDVSADGKDKVALIDRGGQIYVEDDLISTTSMYASVVPWVRVQPYPRDELCLHLTRNSAPRNVPGSVRTSVVLESAPPLESDLVHPIINDVMIQANVAYGYHRQMSKESMIVSGKFAKSVNLQIVVEMSASNILHKENSPIVTLKPGCPLFMMGYQTVELLSEADGRCSVMIRRHLRTGDKLHHFGHKGLIHVVDDERILGEALPDGADVLVPMAGIVGRHQRAPLWFACAILHTDRGTWNNHASVAMNSPDKFVTMTFPQLSTASGALVVKSVVSVALRLPEHAVRISPATASNETSMTPSGYVDTGRHPDAIAVDEMQIDALVGAGARRILDQLSSTSCHKCLWCEHCATIHELCRRTDQCVSTVRRVPPGLANWLVEMSIAGNNVKCKDF